MANFDPKTYFDYTKYPLPSSVRKDSEARILLRDGVRLAASVFRPDNQERYPAIVAISPYGKDDSDSINIFSKVPGSSIGKISVAEDTSFEAPDPGFWVPYGYVIIQVDTRGQGKSEGDTNPLSRQEQQDFLDVIAWAAQQPWCDGRVGLCGVSYLCVTQWAVAQHRPSALKAMIPWEGFGDFYLLNYPGGIPQVGMAEFVAKEWILPHHNPESGFAIAPPGYTPADHPLRDGFWDSTQMAIENIEIPVLICASFSDQGLHSRDSFEHFKRVGSAHKWLYNHRQPKWHAFYDPSAAEVQLKFFNRFLKDENNGFEDTPRVRIEVSVDRDTYWVLTDSTWPLPGRELRPLMLLPPNRLSAEPSLVERPLEYSPAEPGLHFDFEFDQRVDIVGNAKLKLWVEALDADDMDLFVGLSKIDVDGNTVHFTGFGGQNRNDIVARGWLRVSHRELDQNASTPDQPIHSHRRKQTLRPAEIVPVEIEILPSATTFNAGEKLRVIVQGHPIEPDAALLRFLSSNRGAHRVWTGGNYDSHVLLPFLREHS